jgi:acyl carrier protein
MNSQIILTRLATIIEDMVSVPADEITTDKSLSKDLEVDSLASVEIMVSIEDAFGCAVPDEVMKEFVTIGDVVAYIEREGIPVAA